LALLLAPMDGSFSIPMVVLYREKMTNGEPIERMRAEALRDKSLIQAFIESIKSVFILS
jgi:hypothetical protein